MVKRLNNPAALQPAPVSARPEQRLPEVVVPPGPRRRPVVLRRKKGQTDDQVLAAAALSSGYTNAMVAHRFSNSMNNELGLTEMVEVVDQASAQVHGGDMQGVEGMLVAQSLALNAIFCEMAGRAARQITAAGPNAEAYLRMALKAQNQCRATLETLAEVKNPRQATFVRQQNIANQQQVNNGLQAGQTRPHVVENENRSNQQLEDQHGQRMDTGAQGAPVEAYSDVAAVEQVHRSAERRR